jgi:hypothetical protein
MTIHKQDDYTISRDDDDNIFYIRFTSRSEQLIKSFSKQLVGMTVFADYKTVYFRASSVKTYTQFRDDLRVENGARRMNYADTLSMVTDLTMQLSRLLAQNKCFYVFDPNNLIVVDGNKFIYVSNEHLLDFIPRRGTVLFIKPFIKLRRFSSPEVSRIVILPSEINHKAIYYSLGVLALYSLYDDDAFDDEDDKMKSIKGTKLYWLLKRCLDEDPNKRSILFI